MPNQKNEELTNKIFANMDAGLMEEFVSAINEERKASPNQPAAVKEQAPVEQHKSMENKWDLAYNKLVQDILEKGQLKPVNGNNTISLIHQQIQVDLSDGSFPLLTTRKVNFQQVVDELLWDMSGSHSVGDAGSAKVFWKHLADADGNLPSVYGRFLTRFPRYYAGDTDPGEQVAPSWEGEVNQLGWIIQELFANPFSRRLVASFWHPANATVSKQPPCHVSLVFNVTGDASHLSLNLMVTQRSADVALGLVIDVPKWSLLVLLMASYLKINPGLVTFAIADAHIYEDHEEQIKEQIKREPTGAPYVRFDSMPLCDYTADDIELIGYQPHPRIRYQLAIPQPLDD